MCDSQAALGPIGLVASVYNNKTKIITLFFIVRILVIFNIYYDYSKFSLDRDNIT